jgi:hypothetical protein
MLEGMCLVFHYAVPKIETISVLFEHHNKVTSKCSITIGVEKFALTEYTEKILTNAK